MTFLFSFSKYPKFFHILHIFQNFVLLSASTTLSYIAHFLNNPLLINYFQQELSKEKCDHHFIHFCINLLQSIAYHPLTTQELNEYLLNIYIHLLQHPSFYSQIERRNELIKIYMHLNIYQSENKPYILQQYPIIYEFFKTIINEIIQTEDASKISPENQYAFVTLMTFWNEFIVNIGSKTPKPTEYQPDLHVDRFPIDLIPIDLNNLIEFMINSNDVQILCQIFSYIINLSYYCDSVAKQLDKLTDLVISIIENNDNSLLTLYGELIIIISLFFSDPTKLSDFYRNSSIWIDSLERFSNGTFSSQFNVIFLGFLGKVIQLAVSEGNTEQILQQIKDYDIIDGLHRMEMDEDSFISSSAHALASVLMSNLS